MKKLINYFSKLEIALWLTSVSLIVMSFLAFDRTNYLTLLGVFIINFSFLLLLPFF